MKKEKSAAPDDQSGDNPLNPIATVLERAEAKQAERVEREAVLADADRDAIDKIILATEFGKGGKIRISRKGPTDQTHQFVCYIKADDWDNEDSIEYLRKMFGGGDYKCQTYRANGQMYKMFTFSIDYRYKGQLDESAIRALADEKGATADNTSKLLEVLGRRDDGMKMSDMITMMRDSASSQTQMLLMMMTMQQKSAEQQSTMQMQMMTAMVTAMSAAMAGKPADTGTQALLLKLIEQKQERTPMSETLDMMAQIKDIFDKPKSDEEPDDMLTKIGKVAGPLLSGLMGGAPNVARPQVSAPQPARPAETAPVEQPDQPAGPKLGGLYAQLPPMQRVFFDTMLGAASRNSDPALYADLIIDQTPEAELPKLKEILTAPDWCAKLFGDENAVAAIRPWLEELRSMILEYGTTSDQPAQPATGSPNPTAPGPA